MRRIIAGAFALTLVLNAPGNLWGQERASFQAGHGAGRPRFEYFVTRLGETQDGGSGAPEGAVGGRLMWGLPVPRDARFGWIGRASLGGGVTRSVSEDDRQRVWRYGLETDFQLVSNPVADRFDPFLTVALGARRSSSIGGQFSLPAWSPELSPAPRETTRAFVAPGVGLRVRMGPRIGLLTAAREVWDFDGTAQPKLEVSAGLSFGT